ncbi:MAG: hypothetical protein M0Q49_09425 [Porticoccaceae bacterium]|jgi:hypothetical protein|nr:hypothetical protein [Porticoccaceae bacterium]
MSDYLFIQSQDPLIETAAGQCRLATQMHATGHGVPAFAVQEDPNEYSQVVAEVYGQVDQVWHW